MAPITLEGIPSPAPRRASESEGAITPHGAHAPDDAPAHRAPADTVGASPQRVPRRHHPRRLIASAIVLCLIAGGVIAFVLLTRGAPPSTPLGATGEVPGGVARIDGAIPLEVDGWVPPTPTPALQTSVPDGLHRVRILLDLISLGEGGTRFDAADYAIDGIGVSSGEPLWVSVPTATVAQGQRLGVEFVFEVPDEAVALVLTGPDTTRLALGAGHTSAH